MNRVGVVTAGAAGFVALRHRMYHAELLTVAVDMAALAAADGVLLGFSGVGGRVRPASLAAYSLLVVLFSRDFGVHSRGPRTELLDGLRKVVAAASIAAVSLVVVPTPWAGLAPHDAFRAWWLSTALLLVGRTVVAP